MGNAIKILQMMVEKQRNLYINEKDSLFHLGLTQAYANVLDMIDELCGDE